MVTKMKLKSVKVRNSELVSSKVCNLPGCDTLVTPWAGPGSDLCEVHQQNHKDNGGMGNPKRPYTFNRNTINEITGREADEELKEHWNKCKNQPWYVSWEDLSEEMKNQIRRYYLQVDHKDGNHDNNDPDNLIIMDPISHIFKTVINKDHLNYKYRT